jgi:hypothetical protein
LRVHSALKILDPRFREDDGRFEESRSENGGDERPFRSATLDINRDLVLFMSAVLMAN